ncbi:MAG: multidrug ABC transporter ATP-binding protein [Candidatus Muiribacterium halophilum]|uniref:Multidrug ABC transporter ATP-binding protein n=1 Tax=Muiribacterium halophilum TaxID=2053465 RepID=A0A2N5Z9E6_MUIH1|nr:MAG: multidrug ABC transporter ATP-binding protein [Candidatus Muirbacterium halophilum]
MEEKIVVKGLKKHFGDFKAVDDVSFSIEKGEIFGFLGPNGAGKSTTIKMLTGLLLPTEGKALINGESVFKDPEKVRENIGYMAQKFSLYDDLKVQENIDFYTGIYGIERSLIKERHDWIKEISGIKGFEERKTGDLSLGLKQRLALGCAIMHKPPVLFLDEPTSGVDPVSRARFWETINDLAHDGTTIFITTHYMDEADYCNRLSLIYNGKIIANGSPGQLKEMLADTPIFEIKTDDAVSLMKKIELGKEILEKYYFGQHVHIVASSTEAADDLRESLIKVGINIKSMDRIDATLENVFVSLVHREREK